MKSLNLFHDMNSFLAFLIFGLLFLTQNWLCFCEVVRLNRNNFEESVLQNDDPWIIGIRQKISESELEAVDDEVKDRVNLGLIDETEYVAFLQDIDAPADAYFIKAIRVYPFGAKFHKLRKWENVESCKQAIKKAFASVPDITQLLPNTVDQKNAMLRDFIQSSYANLPPKFPVVLFTDEKTTPIYYKFIALKFSTLFHFALIRNPPPSTLAVYAITKLPRLVILLTEILKDGTPRIKPIPYADDMHGSLDYPRVLRFLYLVHMKFFKQLPGHLHTTSEDIDELFGPHLVLFPELLRLPEGKEKEAMAGKLLPSQDENIDFSSGKPCNDGLDICIMIIGRNFGGSASNVMQLENIKANLSSVRKQLVDRGKSVQIHELDINCNEETEMKFDIYSEDVPVLLLLRPKSHLFAIAVINELPISIESYLQSALQGKIGHRKYDKLPEFRIGNCKANDADASNVNTKAEL